MKMAAAKTKKSTEKKISEKKAGTKTATRKKKTTTRKAVKSTVKASAETPVEIPELPITPETGIDNPIDDITANISGIDTGQVTDETPVTSIPTSETEFPAEDTPISPIIPDDGYDISRKVLARIALMAAGEIEGLAPPKRNPFNMLIDKFQGRTEGIRVDVGTTEAAVDMHIRVQYGSHIPDLTTRLRERIAARIREMTGLNVVEVNIRVQDVTAPVPTA